MLPKSYRLPYSIRLSGGFSIKHPLFIAKVADSEGINPRFGVVISKKIDKRSVKRNRMRRLLHTFIYNNLDSFPQKKVTFLLLHHFLMSFQIIYYSHFKLIFPKYLYD